MATVSNQCSQIIKHDNFLFCYVDFRKKFTVPFNNIDMCDGIYFQVILYKINMRYMCDKYWNKY